MLVSTSSDIPSQIPRVPTLTARGQDLRNAFAVLRRGLDLALRAFVCKKDVEFSEFWGQFWGQFWGALGASRLWGSCILVEGVLDFAGRWSSAT